MGTPTLRICESEETNPAPLPSRQRLGVPTPRRLRNALGLQSSRWYFRLRPNQCENSGPPAWIASNLSNSGFCEQSARQCFEGWPQFLIDGKAGCFSVSSDFGRNVRSLQGNQSMEKILNQHEGPVSGDELESKIRQRLFEKVGRKMAELGYDSASPFHRVKPDVVIIPSGDVRSLNRKTGV